MSRDKVCKLFQPPQISPASPQPLIDYVVALDAAWVSFCLNKED